MKQTEFQWLGTLGYAEALELQHKYAKEVDAKGIGMVMGLEHEPVISLGVRGDLEKDLKTSPTELDRQGWCLVQNRRGGQATLHSPGQLVIYPVLPLRQWGWGVRDYICFLQKLTKATIESYGFSEVNVGAHEPGLFTDQGKIAFFGIRVQKGVSLHGISINIQNNLEHFRHIRSCGDSHPQLDKVARLASEATPPTTFENWRHLWDRMHGVTCIEGQT